MSRALQRWLLLLLIGTVLYGLTWTQNWSLRFAPALRWRRPAKNVNWSRVSLKYPKTNPISLPSASPRQLPQIQAAFPVEPQAAQDIRLQRKNEVKDVFVRSWKAYKEHAWGHDEFTPLTKAFKDHFGGWGATLVDSLDSLLIMGLNDEFDEAIKFVKTIDFSVSHMETINLYETTVRYLGGLLGAHELAKGRDGGVLVGKAKELGEMLYHAFDTRNGMPLTRWMWQASLRGEPEEPHSYVLAAELGGIVLEFTRLAQVTGEAKFYDVVQRITDVIEREQTATKIPGLWPVVFNAQSMSFRDDSLFTMGGRADTLYEYVLKQYILLGGTSSQHQNMYTKFIQTAKKELFFRPMTPSNLDILLSGSSEVQFDKAPKLKAEGQHLSCFVGGMVGLAAKVFNSPEDVLVAKKLCEGCVWAYESTASGIMPEVFGAVPPLAGQSRNKWDKARWLQGLHDMYPADANEVKDVHDRAQKIASSLRIPQGMTTILDGRYLLRPEAIESLFVVYRITADASYPDKAWRMFKSIEAATRTDLSYASVPDVTVKDGSRSDASESFWMAETLKYFYLMFSEPDVMSLDEFVFNSEAHPFRIPKPMHNQS